jgi:hypothetical protein
MTRRIKNTLIGTVVAIVVWVFWLFIRHMAFGGSFVFEHINRCLPTAAGCNRRLFLDASSACDHPGNPGGNCARTHVSH